MGFAAGRNHLVLIAGLLALSAGISEAAGEARLVREIRTSSFLYSSLPDGFVGLGDSVYFVADSPTNGRELWRTDGTSEGTQLIRDIRPGPEDSDLGPLVPVGDTLFFRADDGERDAELWKSDGTTAGTVLLKEFETFYRDHKPFGLTEFAGKLYFSHSRQSGLWTSDGTEEGTEVVSAVGPVEGLVNAGSKLFLFVGDDEIWTSDGTESGTKRVASNVPAPANAGFASVGGVLFFAVYAEQVPGDHSTALWKSDGTSAGTSVVAETFPGIGEPAVGSLTPFGHELLFTVSEYGASTPRGLWKTDGTTAGTVKIAEGVGDEIAVSGGTGYFTATDEESGWELWATDGTPAGTRRVADIYPGPTGSSPEKLTDYDGTLVFNAYEPGFGRELWKSDSTPTGTQRIKDLNPGAADSSPQNFGVVNGSLFFTATDGASGFELWKSDGSPSGTQSVANVAGDGDGSGIDEPTELDGVLYFKARANGDWTGWQGTGLWRSDGSEAGTHVVKEIRASHAPATLRDFRVFFDQLYFLAAEGYSWTELWTSDGTAEGTRALTDLGPGTAGCVDYPPVQLRGSLIFAGREGGQHGLWRTNGIGEGTELLKSFASMNLYFSGLKIAMGKVLFPADDGSGAGDELWRSDGTPEGTVLLKDLVPGSGGSMIWHTGVFRHRYFFAPYLPDEMGRELWVSDGSESGTELFLDLMEGPSSSAPEYLTATDRHLFFRAYGQGGRRALWATDATLAGSVALLDPIEQTGASPEFVPIENRLFFAHDDAEHGLELWVSNGTPDGTLLVRDIEPGPMGSIPTQLRNVDGRLFFRACTAEFGCELWRSDGTESGTRRLTDIAPGPESSNPANAAAAGGTLFFSAYDLALGDELHAFDLGSCGDGEVDALEECDDGNRIPGDGCSTICDTDVSWGFEGTAAGGTLSLTIEGVALEIVTLPGQTAEEVATALAQAIEANNVLGGRGISAWAHGRGVFTDGAATEFSLEDPGLVTGSPWELPALGIPAQILLAAAIALAASRRL